MSPGGFRVHSLKPGAAKQEGLGNRTALAGLLWLPGRPEKTGPSRQVRGSAWEPLPLPGTPLTVL